VRITLAHGKTQTLQHLRAPGYLLPTLAMPGLFYFLFEGPDTEVGLVTLLMASYAMWAVLGVAFFQFGVGIAEERTTAWERFLHTLPLSAGQRLGGRVLSAGLFAAAAAAVVIALAHLINPVSVAADRWLPWTLALGAGGVVMALGGIALGYWASPRAATALATLAWLLLAYLGGLWVTPGELPGWASEVSRYLPTRLWAEVTWAAVQGQATSPGHWLGLTAYAVGFAVLAGWGYRRDEGASYR
jgi:ABC-2 type transport system permease protein